ncbi:MAG TPA: hypothetical protein VHQ64_06470 [Pyrinomonadaceae bacterium]|jgi:hypothetical protein|nr:hypothetical protein [Pyrinomonadaceae bacterium]
MNDNYLWDRTGEPDAEVQHLEDLLGSLRYQPRPLEIPPSMNVRRKRAFIPLAIAAAIALLMIGAGLWVRFANSNRRPVLQAERAPDSTAPPLIARSSNDQPASSSTLPEPRESSSAPRKANRGVIAPKSRRPIQPAAPVLTAEELAQKEQVIVALRLVSFKLNLAQRKAQGLPQINSIRNHKIG